MAYIRKTEDIFNIQQLTNYGWEDATAETSWKAAKASIKEYRENAPEYSYRIKLKRESIES